MFWTHWNVTNFRAIMLLNPMTENLVRKQKCFTKLIKAYNT